MQKHHWVLFTLIALAAASYMSGFLLGSAVLLGVGMLLEGAFWINLLRRKRSSKRQ